MAQTKLSEYINQINPKFFQHVRGATNEEIAKLERLVGFPLPLNYREYLFDMGNTEPFYDLLCIKEEGGTSDIFTIICLYEDSEFVIERIPSECLFICLNTTMDEDLVMSMKDNSYGQIFTSFNGKIRSFESSSLENLLFRHCFLRYRVRRMPWHVSWNTQFQRGLLEEVATRVQKTGFQPHLFSEKDNFFAEKDDILVKIRNFNTITVFELSGYSHSALNQIGKIITSSLGFIKDEDWYNKDYERFNFI